jgi:hypothetical protein
MKTEYNIKDKVWIHIGERKLTGGRVVEIIDLEHLNEGHDPNRELYVIEIETGIEDVYEIRSFEQISPDAKGPINLFRKINTQLEQRALKRIGIVIPNKDGVIPAQKYVHETNTDNPIDFPQIKDVDNEDEDGPTPEQIHAAMDAAEKAKSQIFQPMIEKPKRTSKPRRKPFNRRKKNDA